MLWKLNGIGLAAASTSCFTNGESSPLLVTLQLWCSGAGGGLVGSLQRAVARRFLKVRRHCLLVGWRLLPQRLLLQ